MKRITIATLFGLVAGALCATASFKMGILALTTVNVLWVFLNRAVMGFAIGISGLRLHWTWNGVVMGLAVGSIFSYFLYMHGMKMAPYTMIGNAIFGLMIEFFTTVVFKAPALAKTDSVAPVTAA
jgi:hypothetical protein